MSLSFTKTKITTKNFRPAPDQNQQDVEVEDVTSDQFTTIVKK